jgi:hypothetical protein
MAVVGFDKSEEEIALPCGLSFKVPTFLFGFTLPTIAFPPPIPIPVFGFSLSCNPTDPINITAGLDYGGSRTPRYEQSPDETDT